MATDRTFMERALELAARAPFTSPNPRVGAVLTRGGEPISEGYHLGAGHPHAEALALEDIDAAGTTLYVTLEPCSHHGRTPPCAPAVAEAGVERVVVAMTDPDPRVSGRGIALLRDRGVEVEVGLCAAQARRLNAPYLWHRHTGRPLVELKLALTLDGRLSASDGSSRWITGPQTRRRVHRRRAAVDALLVGAGTVLADDPELTAREVDSERQPVRVVVDATGRVPSEARALAPGEVLVATTSLAPHERQTAWKETGAEVIVLPENEGRVGLGDLFDDLGRRGFLEVLCEGGAQLATSLLREELVDRLSLHYGAVLSGGGPAIGELGIDSLSDAPRWSTTSVQRSGNDALVELESSRLARLLDDEGGD